MQSSYSTSTVFVWYEHEKQTNSKRLGPAIIYCRIISKKSLEVTNQIGSNFKPDCGVKLKVWYPRGEFPDWFKSLPSYF